MATRWERLVEIVVREWSEIVSVQYVQNMDDVSLWTNEVLSSGPTMSAATEYYALQMKQWNKVDLRIRKRLAECIQFT